MENSPLHVCRLQPARGELMSALLDVGGAFGARKGGSLGRRFCFVLSPEVVYQRSLIFTDFQRLQIDLQISLGMSPGKPEEPDPGRGWKSRVRVSPKRGNSLLLEPC